MIFEYSFEYFSILRIYSYSYSVNFQFPNIFDIRIRPKINIRDNTDTYTLNIGHVTSQTHHEHCIVIEIHTPRTWMYILENTGRGGGGKDILDFG